MRQIQVSRGAEHGRLRLHEGESDRSTRQRLGHRPGLGREDAPGLLLSVGPGLSSTKYTCDVWFR